MSTERSPLLAQQPATNSPPHCPRCEEAAAARAAERPVLEARRRVKALIWIGTGVLLIGIVAFFVWGQLQAGGDVPGAEEMFEAEFCKRHSCGLDLEEEGHTFAVLGDWGRNGHHHQAKLAKAMGEVCERRSCEFVVSVGDNMYPSGVSSAEDPQWRDSFEDVYDDDSLDVPWYAVLGNHDYMGNPAAQIEYSRHSDRWNMPARYFSRRVRLGGAIELALVFLDTNPLLSAYCRSPLFSEDPCAQSAERQLAWLDRELAAAADADWRLVVGHHPAYSAAAAPEDDGGDARRDERGDVRRALLPLFRRHHVHAYLSGHDHTLQHLKPTDGPTHYLISGAGSKTANHFRLDEALFDRIEPDFFGSRHTGFFTLTVLDRDRIQVVAYSRHKGGKIRYANQISK